jgi:dihydroflavonol-4-reductase
VRPGSNLRPLDGLPRERLQIAFGDITAMHTVYRALFECDRLYHVAALYTFWDRSPQRVIDAAVVGTREVLTAARHRKLRRIVVTSTLGTFGAEDAPVAMAEDHEYKVRPDTDPYVVGKVAAEQHALEQARDGLPIVIVNPGAVFGPGDWKPTPSGNLLLELLKRGIIVAPKRGGLSVVDVDDVAEGHRLAMEKGRIGERYALGGDNLEHRQIDELFAELAGADKPLITISKGTAELAGRLMELGARLGGPVPLVTYRMARDFAFRYLWASSEKAEKELGYTHRPARRTLLRSLLWYLEHKYVPQKIAQDLAPVRA